MNTVEDNAYTNHEDLIEWSTSMKEGRNFYTPRETKTGRETEVSLSSQL